MGWYYCFAFKVTVNSNQIIQFFILFCYYFLLHLNRFLQLDIFLIKVHFTVIQLLYPFPMLPTYYMLFELLFAVIYPIVPSTTWTFDSMLDKCRTLIYIITGIVYYRTIYLGFYCNIHNLCSSLMG